MPRITFIPQHLKVEIDQDASILDAARRLKVKGLAAIDAPCGGRGRCGQCRVQIRGGHVSSPDESEAVFLGKRDVDAGIRLACRCVAEGDVDVFILPESSVCPAVLQVADELESVTDVDLFKSVTVDLGTSLPDVQRGAVSYLLEKVAKITGVAMEINPDHLLEMIADIKTSSVSVVVSGNRIVKIEAAAAGNRMLGVAVDFGSTKIAAYLIDLQSGETLATAAMLNPQVQFGADIVSRISYVVSADAMDQIQEISVECLQLLVEDMVRETETQFQDIVAGVVVGNTAMHHFLLGVPVRQLGLSPYKPALDKAVSRDASQLGIWQGSVAELYFPPVLDGFIGSDHLAMIVASDILQSGGVVLGIDLGTNTELVLTNDGELYSASCASGPAFEGGNIRSGVRAVEGAVWKVRLRPDGQIICETIGNKPPIGFCGSGIIDAISVLLEIKVLNSIGLLDANHERVRFSDETRELEFVFINDTQTGIAGDLTLSQNDISAIQLAKGAVRAGITMLLDRSGLEETDVDTLLICGAFGCQMSRQSAVGIGLLPDIPIDRIRMLGNGAGAGARLQLISAARREEADMIRDRIQYVELAGSSLFNTAFAKALRF